MKKNKEELSVENIYNEKCVYIKLLRCVSETVKLQRILREAGEREGVVVCKGEAEPRETSRKDSQLKSVETRTLQLQMKNQEKAGKANCEMRVNRKSCSPI